MLDFAFEMVGKLLSGKQVSGWGQWKVILISIII